MSSGNVWKRVLVPVRASVEAFPVNGDVTEVLRSEAKNYHYLLAHTEGGVVWGRVESEALKLAPGAVDIFTKETLQEAWLFGAHEELHVWRIGDAAFHGRRVRDGDGSTYTQAFDEQRILWGDHCEKDENGFSLLADGMQGLRHWAPVTGVRSDRRSVYLRVRSYVGVAVNGALQVVDARLVGVEVEGG